jgi:MarR family transcriptional regulator, transcriptional regulator for hemolysin
VNSSANERFQDAFRQVWLHLRRGDDPDLSEHERQLLHHIPQAAPGVTLGEVADHLALPRSSASVLVKDLARRGFVRRARDRSDERRLALLLTAEGARRVAADSVLDPERLEAALAALPARERDALVDALERVAAAGAAAGPPPPGPRSRRRARSGARLP